MINKNLFPLYLIGLYPAALVIGTLISEIITIILAILFISECFKNNKFLLFKDPLIYFLFIIWGYLLINLFYSMDFQISLNRSIFFIRYILIILSIAYFLKKYQNNINIVFGLWMITILITIIDLYVQFFFGQNLLGFKSPWDERLSGFFNQELKVAHLLIAFFLPTISYFYEKNSKNIYLYLIIFLYFVILILTNERANIIRGTLALTVIILFFKNLKLTTKFYSLLTIIGIFLVIVTYVTPINQRFVKEIQAMQKFNKENKVTDYIILSNYGPHYLSSIEIFKKNKLIGSGIKTFRLECKNISLDKYYMDKNQNLKNSGCNTHPHQYYFEILSELGLIGFTMFVCFFMYLFYRIFNTYRNSKNLVLLSCGLFITFQLIPLLPTGSFFTSFGSTIFFINISLIYYHIKKYE